VSDFFSTIFFEKHKVEGVKSNPMKTKFIILASIAMLLAGCHNYDVNGTAPVRYANSVFVTAIDPTKREPSKSIQLFANEDKIKRPHHVIAILSREGFLQDQGMIVNALVWRAKQLGADGIILLGAMGGNTSSGMILGNGNGVFGSSNPDHASFSATAIVFDDTTTTPSK
jgi:hypothetical protein